MKLMRPLSIAAIVAVVMVGCSSNDDSESVDDKARAQLSDADILVAADSGSVKPLKYTEDGSDEIIGLIPDLTEEYAERLGVDLDIQRVSGDAVVPGLQSNRFDVALGIGDFQERQDEMDFIDFVGGGVMLMARDGELEEVENPDDLCGHSLGLMKGSIQQSITDEAQDQCESNGEADIEVSTYSDGPSTAVALESGRVDIMWTDLADGLQLLEQEPDTFSELYQEEMAPYGVGVTKDKEDLRDAIYEALTEMKEDGTYDEILSEYDLEDLGVDEIQINGSEF